MSKPRKKACPICRKAMVAEFSPFCSQGCKDRDLLRWLGEGYSIPGPMVDEEGKEIDLEG